MVIKVFKTFELQDSDWIRIVSGFNRSFDRKTTKERLLCFYQSNSFGYAYHAVCYENDTVIGFTSILPFQYLYKERIFKAGISCGSFVLKEFRYDAFILKDMLDALKTECVKNDFSVFLGVPNKNAFNYLKTFSGFKLIGNLNYYALPSKLLTVLRKDKFKFLNVITSFCFHIHCFINLIFSYIYNSKEKLSEYRLLITDDFHKTRFSASHYSYAEKGAIKCWYRIVDEAGIITAYLMDFRENSYRTNKALCVSVWHILNTENVDMLLYVGTLRMKQGLLFKTPSRFQPKQLPLIYGLLETDNKEQFDSMANIKLWDFGLMNFDGR